MKGPQEQFDPGARVIPSQWMKSRPQDDGHEPRRAHGHGTHQWMSTLPAPVARVRASALQVFEDLGAEVAYRYEGDAKTVFRCTLPKREIRTELVPVGGAAAATRIMVVATEGADVDRAASARILRAIERELEPA